MIARLNGSRQLDLLVRGQTCSIRAEYLRRLNGSYVSAKTAHGGAHRSRRGAAARDCQ